MYIYVDGENHFLRTQEFFRRHWNLPSFNLAAIGQTKLCGGLAHRFPPHGTPDVIVIPECQFFWHVVYATWLAGIYPPTRDSGASVIRRAVFFSSCRNEATEIQRLNELVRQCFFEPNIVVEKKDLRDKRKKQLDEYKLMEKPKGVDVEMATRIAADAFQDNYQNCVLFTNDADFLPVIRLVRQLGKSVTVCGYRSMVPEDSQLRYVPDHYLDLEPETARLFKEPPGVS